jgi:hypothetical protein
MADVSYQNLDSYPARMRINWGAVWAGMFAFVAIWSVFGVLGEAIFASAANPNTQYPVTGMSVGMAVWSVILTIIAMYVAGRVTGHLAGVTNRHDGLLHGLTMFGLAVVATLIITIFAGSSLSGASGVNATTHNAYILSMLAEVGWIGFVALFLGWLAAMGGAAAGVGRRKQLEVERTEESTNVRHIRPAV